MAKLRELAMEERVEDSSVALTRLQNHVAGVAQLAEQGIQRPGDPSRPISSNLLNQLEEDMEQARLAEGVLRETLNQSPANAGADIERALEAIQKGRERVRSAVAAAEPVTPPVGPPVVPKTPAPPAGGQPDKGSDMRLDCTIHRTRRC